MLSLADVLDLPVVRRALPEVVISDAALGRQIRWAHVIEMPEPDDLLKGGELVLTTGLGAGADPVHQAAWTASLVEQGLAALAVELGSSWREVPAPVVAQVSRSSRQAQLRRFLTGCVVVPLNESEAHEAGRLLGLTRTADVVDAVVVTTALRQ